MPDDFVQQHRQARRDAEQLTEALNRTGDELINLGTALKQRPLKVAFYLPGNRQMILDKNSVPIRHDLIDAAKIQQMLTDLRTAQKTLRRMQQELE